VWLCGVRGSTPAPGPEFVRYGGNTSCVAVAHDGERPSLVLDAGTGIRALSRVLDGPFVGSILLGHLHWDHTQGLPFAPAFDHEGASVTLFQPAQGDPVTVLGRAMSPPHFPIEPGQLRGTWSFVAMEAGEHAIDGFSVLALDIPHKGGRTFGFRVTDRSGRSLAYLSDHWPISLGGGPDGLGEYHPAVLALCEGVDLILHDAQYTADELPARAEWGHSAIEYAVGLADRCGSSLLLYHHDPNRTDDALDALVAPFAGHSPSIGAAVEGTVLDL